MKGDNPPRQYIKLYCDRATQTGLDYEDEAKLYGYFPPIRGRSRTLCPQATQGGSQKPPLSSKEEPSQSQHRRQPSMGLGRANVVNTVAVRPYTLYIYVAIADHEWFFIFIRPNPP